MECYSFNLPSGGVLIIEPLRSFSPSEIEESLYYNRGIDKYSQKRINEKLTWRSMVREYLGRPNLILSYNEVGAPQIEGSDLHIAVSHSATHVAVVISPSPCAVDIENVDRDFAKVASRFATDRELSLTSHPHALALLWCAKETLYKFAGRRELSLIGDIEVTALDPQGSHSFSGSITPHTTTINGVAKIISDHALTFIG